MVIVAVTASAYVTVIVAEVVALVSADAVKTLLNLLRAVSVVVKTVLELVDTSD